MRVGCPLKGLSNRVIAGGRQPMAEFSASADVWKDDNKSAGFEKRRDVDARPSGRVFLWGVRWS